MFLRCETDTLRIMLYSCQNQFVISITSSYLTFLLIYLFWDSVYLGGMAVKSKNAFVE